MTSDLQLLLSVVVAFVIIIYFITKLKLPPFVAIFAGAIAAGLVCGLPAEQIAKSFSENAGKILGDSGFIIALGAMLGSIMTRTGAADEIANFLLSKTSVKWLPWTMAGVAMIIGLPLFFEVGLVLMIPLIVTVSKRSGVSIMKIAIPALAGMTTLHALVPPHPGPVIAIKQLNADMGLSLLIGVLLAIPTVALAGPLYGNWLSKHKRFQSQIEVATTTKAESNQVRPSLPISILLILLPAILMLLRSLCTYVLPHDFLGAEFLEFIGEPIIALTITVLLALILLGWKSGIDHQSLGSTLSQSIGPIAVMILTIGAGGGLKGVLVLAGISTTIGHLASEAHLPLILLAWMIAVVVRQATGSATVATTTTAGIFAASFAGLTAPQSSLIALAIGSGSVFFCHVNDAAYWMIKEYFRFDLIQTVWVWSVLQTIVSVMGLILTGAIWYALY